MGRPFARSTTSLPVRLHSALLSCSRSVAPKSPTRSKLTRARLSPDAGAGAWCVWTRQVTVGERESSWTVALCATSECGCGSGRPSDASVRSPGRLLEARSSSSERSRVVLSGNIGVGGYQELSRGPTEGGGTISKKSWPTDQAAGAGALTGADVGDVGADSLPLDLTHA